MIASISAVVSGGVSDGWLMIFKCPDSRMHGGRPTWMWRSEAFFSTMRSRRRNRSCPWMGMVGSGVRQRRCRRDENSSLRGHGGLGGLVALGGRQDLLDRGGAVEDLADAVLGQALEAAGELGLLSDPHGALALER